MSASNKIAAELINPAPKRQRALSSTELAIGLDQYKLFVQTADKLSERRQTANTFFLSITTALIGVLGLGSGLGDNPGSSPLTFLLSLAGLAITFSWFLFIQSYRKLSAAKYKVIHEMEHTLPLRPYHAEWEALGRGEEARTYLPFTKIEAVIPWVFIVTFAAIFLLSLLSQQIRAALCGA